MRRVQKGRESSKRILRAAARIIAFRGLEAASITEIAKEAGCSRALVAHYFPQKKELFSRIVSEILSEGYQQIESGLSAAQKTGASLALEIVVQNFRFFASNPEYANCLILLYYFSTFDPAMKALTSGVVAKAVERLAEALKQEGVPEPAARAEKAHSFLVGAILKYLASHHSKSPAVYEMELVEGVQGIIGQRRAER